MKQRILTGLATAFMMWPHALHATGEDDTGQAQLTLDHLRTFTDVFNQVRQNFVEEIDDVTLLNAAIRGMIMELDKHSVFLGADAFRIVNDTSHGRYGGIGVEVDIENQRIVIIRVSEDGPASRAGVRAGDIITAVNDQPVRGRRLYEAIDELRGEPGSEVSLRIQYGEEPVRTVELSREYIPVPSVDSNLLEGQIGYFRITHFHENSHEDLAKAIDELRMQVHTPLRGVILDLRNNMGGVIQPAVAIADGFLEEGLIVYTRSRYQGTQLEFSAKPGEWLPGVPLALLVNRTTASASEVLAGALQDHGRATVFGEQTYGKGTIQSMLALRDGSALRLTTARYFTPSGKSIQDKGIEPDIVVEDSETQDEALAQALEHLR